MEDERAERRAQGVQASVDAMRQELAKALSMLGAGANSERVEQLSQQINEVATIIKGNPTLGMRPLSERLAHLEAKIDVLDQLVKLPATIERLNSQISNIEQERSKEKALLRGIAWGLGLNGVGFLGLLAQALGLFS